MPALPKSFLFIIALILVLPIRMDAQNNGVFLLKGRVENEKGEPIEFAMLKLLHAADSSFIKGEVSDQHGQFMIQVDNSEGLILVLSAINIEQKFIAIPPFDRKTVDLGNVRVREKSKLLSEIKVSVDKPLFENKLGKIIVNVKESPLATSSSVLDLLPNLPTIEVSTTGDITLKGKGGGILVLIDGKGRYVDSQQISEILSNMPSETVEKIEIIRNPSSKFEASGGGIINIVTTKDKSQSMLNSSYRQFLLPYKGEIGSRYHSKQIGVGLNTNIIDNIGIFSDFSFRDNTTLRKIHGYRRNFDLRVNRKEEEFTSYSQGVLTYKAGLNYNLSKRAKIDIVYSGLNYLYQNGITQFNYEYSNLNSIQEADSSHTLNGNINWPSLNSGTLSTSIEYALDSNGSNITVYYDHNDFRRTKELEFVNEFDSPNESTSEQFYNLRDYKININTAGLDTRFLLNAWDFELGSRMTSYKSVDDNTGTSRSDTNQRFRYEEWIVAGYGLISKKINSFEFQIGLRAENTLSKGRSLGRTDTERRYFNWFPSFSVDVPIQKSTLNLSFNRRIFRPAASDFNPNKVYANSFLFQRGNTNLKPEFTDYFELSYLIKGITTSFSFSRSKDLSRAVPISESVTQIQDSLFNPGNQDKYEFYLNYPVSIGDRWNIFNNMNMYYYTNSLDGVNGNDVYGFSLFSGHSYSFGNGSKFEINLNYSSPFIDGYTKIRDYFMASIGYNTDIFNENFIFSMRLNDIFGTYKIRAIDNYGVQLIQRDQVNNNRTFGFSLRYRFSTGRSFNKRERFRENFGETRY